MLKTRKKTPRSAFDSVIDFQLRLDKLPPLAGLDKAKFEHDFAIDQLYYSSKLEGTILTSEEIDSAIYGTKIQASEG